MAGFTHYKLALMRSKLLIRVLICGALSLAAFAQTPAAPKPAAAPKPVREPGLYATMATSMGTVLIKFYDKEAPITVKNFTDLAMGRKEYLDPKTNLKVKKPLYNGLTFHRVIPNFMIQGGDPTGTGMGGTENIPDEFHPSLQFDRPGRLAMANTGQPSSGSCQFFITDATPTHLNNRHTIFGQVIEGQDVVDKIARVPADPSGNKPLTPVRIVRVTVQRFGTTAAKPGAAKPGVAKPKPGTPKPGVAKPKARPAGVKTKPPA